MLLNLAAQFFFENQELIAENFYLSEFPMIFHYMVVDIFCKGVDCMFLALDRD